MKIDDRVGVPSNEADGVSCRSPAVQQTATNRVLARRVLVVAAVCAAILMPVPCFAAEETQPLPESQRQAITAEHQRTIARVDKLVAEKAADKNAYSRRGDAYFFLGQFDKAVADYEKMVELDPSLDASHWRRGIAWFYAGKFKSAAKQFERYHSFDNVDRENGIWRFFCQCKSVGVKQARQNLLKYEKTDRPPFPQLYRLFAGDTTGPQILQDIRAAKLADKDLQAQLFYAELYIGLDHAVHGRADAAKVHLAKAVANKWPQSAGYGPHYMWHVGRVEYNRLTAVAKKPK